VRENSYKEVSRLRLHLASPPLFWGFARFLRRRSGKNVVELREMVRCSTDDAIDLAPKTSSG